MKTLQPDMTLTVKRLFDITLSSAALLALSPVVAATALLVRQNFGSPVFFRQERPGLGGVPFKLVKFRTMTNAFSAGGAAKSDAERLTPFGKKLRATSLDELPELWNILKGEMSFVGPRPLLTAYLPLYDARQARRHDVRPGLTGWAQINGRNTLNWEDRFEHDIWYVENQTLWLDIKIMFRTFSAVLRREGISAAQEATMPPFKGSQI
jgi:lipopolysaccharide/colanic/teichoic acid biosynthesis glycosyltransferase